MPVAKIIAALQLPPFRVGATRPMSWYEDFLFSNARIFVDAGISAIKVQDETREEGAAAIQTVARMAALGRAFRREFPGVSLGIIVQAPDAKAPLAIADACDADFVRMKVFVGAAVNAEGMRNALNVSAMQYRDLIGRTDIRIYADVHDRTCVPLAGMPHDTAAVWAQSLGADGIILTGANFADTLARITAARVAGVVKPVLIGGGVTVGNIGTALAAADGVIVSTSLLRDGASLDDFALWDRVKVLRLVDAAAQVATA